MSVRKQNRYHLAKNMLYHFQATATRSFLLSARSIGKIYSGASGTENRSREEVRSLQPSFNPTYVMLNFCKAESSI